MAIDFTLPAEVEEARSLIRKFLDNEVLPTEERLFAGGRSMDWRGEIQGLRDKAQEWGTPLESMLKHARSAGLVDGADEVHLQTIAKNLISAWEEDGELATRTGNLLT